MSEHVPDPADDLVGGTSGTGGSPAAPAPDADGNRLERLTDGVRHLRAGGRIKLDERILLLLAGIVAPLGLIAVLIGWYGAAHTPHLFEQVPYLISGGLFGIALVFLGGFFYFAHWLTTLVKEHRAQSAAVVEAIGRLETALTRAASPLVAGNGSAGPPPAAVPADDVALVATERGTMAHRPDCVVVAGKPAVRAVSAHEGLAPCKLCDPYAVTAN
jgi:hypothetical protein